MNFGRERRVTSTEVTAYHTETNYNYFAMPKVTCVNPVFVRLLEEWKAEIVEKNPEDSRQFSLGKAISAVRASKEVFRTP